MDGLCHGVVVLHAPSYRRRVRAFGVTVALAYATAACPGDDLPPPLPPVSAGKAHVRVFTEPAAVRAIAAVNGAVLVATDNGLERWDATGHVDADDSLVARAIVPDPPAAWLVGDSNVIRVDAATGSATLFVPPADLDPATITALAPTGDPASVFVGSPRGLAVATADGWQPTGITDPVRALARDAAGWLWVATGDGLVARKPSGETVRLDADTGCALRDVRLLAIASGDRVVAIGSDDSGHERVAIGRDHAWTTFRTLPGVRWDAAIHRNNTVILRGGDRLYRLAPADGSDRDRPLARDGIRLVAVAAAPIESPGDWTIDPIDLVLPSGALALGVADDQLLVGTRELGTARYRDGDRHPRDWLRRRAMFTDATALAVACTAREDCWLATGARGAWHWTGDRFAAAGPADDAVLAVVRDPSNVVYALHRTPAEPTTIHVSRLDATTWTELSIALATPGDRAELAFARFSAPGKLWVGLRYREDDEPLSFGVAVVEPIAGRVTYRDTDHGIPVGAVAADVRGATAWIATDDRVVRLTPSATTEWTTSDGVRGDLRAITIAPSGDIVVATRVGAGTFDGRAWDFPAALRFEVNDVVATRSGAWMATERGVVAWDGRNLRRFDTLRGLAENEVLDVAADQYDRIWARGPGSLTLITQ
jgi:hypothetical protein